MSDQAKFAIVDDANVRTWKMIEKAVGPFIIIIEMMKAVGDEMITPIIHHAKKTKFERKSSVDWSNSIIINCYKSKKDPYSRDKYHGLKLLDQVFTLIARV